MKRYVLLTAATLLPFTTGCDAYTVASWNYTTAAAANVLSNAVWAARDFAYWWYF